MNRGKHRKRTTAFRKTAAVIAAFLLLLSLTGCEKYTSSYKAVAFIHSNEKTSAFMNFYSFDGTMVFKLHSGGEGALNYTAALESGNAAVYYDYAGRKLPLFTVGGGDTIDSHGGYIEAGTVYVIVETDGACKNGEFRFSVA